MLIDSIQKLVGSWPGVNFPCTCQVNVKQIWSCVNTEMSGKAIKVWIFLEKLVPDQTSGLCLQ